eukprot:TCONS_00063634-protein
MNTNSVSQVTILLLLCCGTLVDSLGRGRTRPKAKKCEKITIPLCKDVGYNETYMPNNFGQSSQFEAGLIIHQFWPLVLINCSPLLKHFVCSLYAPMCDPIYFKEIVPCRSFCEDVRDSCTAIMKNNGFDWPSHLKCEQFPTRKENSICMKPSNAHVSKNNKTTNKPTSSPNSKTVKPNTNNHGTSGGGTKQSDGPYRPPTHINTNGGARGCGCMCKAPFVYPNASSRGELPPCVLPCKQFYFKEDEANFVTFWLGLWSIIAFIGTLITIATFFIDRSRFTQAERPIVFMSFCYFLVAFGYIVRLIYGHDAIACDSKTGLARYAATGPAHCTTVFFMTYFFANVAWIWWVVLSMNWFLSSGLRWPSKAISSYSQYFHFIAWIVPTVQTMAILAMSAIDGDPVSGLCSVGNHNNNNLTIFMIAPLLIYTMLSLSFFVAGVIAIVQRKRHNKSNNGQITPEYFDEERQACSYVSKIGVYTFMVFFPAFTLIGCYFYEHNNKEIWEKSTNCPCVRDKVRPNYYVYLLKYFMSLVIGLISGFWVLDSRTVDSWKRFLLKFVKDDCNENNNLLAAQKYNGAPVQL